MKLFAAMSDTKRIVVGKRAQEVAARLGAPTSSSAPPAKKSTPAKRIVQKSDDGAASKPAPAEDMLSTIKVICVV